MEFEDSITNSNEKVAIKECYILGVEKILMLPKMPFIGVLIS